MKKRIYYFSIYLVIAASVITSCSKDDDGKSTLTKDEVLNSAPKASVSGDVSLLKSNPFISQAFSKPTLKLMADDPPIPGEEPDPIIVEIEILDNSFFTNNVTFEHSHAFNFPSGNMVWPDIEVTVSWNVNSNNEIADFRVNTQAHQAASVFQGSFTLDPGSVNVSRDGQNLAFEYVGDVGSTYQDPVYGQNHANIKYIGAITTNTNTGIVQQKPMD